MNTSRIVFVTGTSSGIGQALAQALLAEGWNVIGLARRAVSFEHASYTHFNLDLGDAQSLQTFAETELTSLVTAKKWQRIGLVNNAAVLGSLKSLRVANPVELAQVFAVNVVAPLYLMGFLCRLVADDVPLRIANISSGAATTGLPGLADYCGSKAALRLAGMSLAAEIERTEWSGNTAVFSYEPGVVASEMQDVARAADPREFASQEFFQGIYDKGMLLSPAEVVAELVAFLASDPAEKFTEMRYGSA